MPHAITVLADGFEEIEAVTYIDLLRRARIEVTVLGLNSLEVRGAHDMRVKADELLSDFCGGYDAIILPGGTPGTNNLAGSAELLSMIRAANEAGKICAAICAAPLVLAKAGILENRMVTCHPSCEGRLSGVLLVKENVVVDDNIITSRAVGTAIPFALALVEALDGKEAAVSIEAAILY